MAGLYHTFNIACHIAVLLVYHNLGGYIMIAVLYNTCLSVYDMLYTTASYSAVQVRGSQCYIMIANLT